MWNIERWFAGGTRRIVLSGFGGQGKTYLAEEAGRWLRRTGMFERVCFVGYASFQGSDAVAVAVSTLATVLGENLIDAAAAGAALARVRTLLILDNLESLDDAPQQELLAAASDWSGQGGSRVLITTRPELAGARRLSARGEQSLSPSGPEGSGRGRRARLVPGAPAAAARADGGVARA